jgi:peptide-methionine (S)-S-oxide reductase
MASKSGRPTLAVVPPVPTHPPGGPLPLLLHQEQDYHQQYLHKVPNGYCGLGGTGISCPVGVVKAGNES